MQGLFITGRPTANVEVRYVGDNKTAFARFSVAHNATYKGKTTTDFFEIAVWGALAEWAGKYVKKGKRIVVKSDRFGFDNFTDKDGNTGRRVQFAQALQFGFTYTFASKK